MLLIFVTFGTLDFQGVAAAAAERAPETLGMGVMTIATLLLFVGATGKSAQIPLHVWLPDAMEGPTPVSALIHAATMVTAGVYMIGRNAVLFSHAPMTLEVVAAIGVATALMAGTIGLVQNDIKRVLAYSTVSQLGYMFLAMGVGAYAAGIFHLYTHAFFKALLFLGSGAVIHALAGEQDLRNMGGLKKYLPITYWTFLIGALAIAGVPLLSGFFSKDEILYKTFVGTPVQPRQHAALGHRRDHVAPDGDLHVPPGVPDVPRRAPRRPRGRMARRARSRRDAHGHGGGHGHGAPHDAPPSMAIPLIVLAIGSVVAGYVGVPHALGGHNQIEGFLEPAFEVHQTAGAGEATAAAEPAAAGRGEAARSRSPAERSRARDRRRAGDIATERMLMAISTGIALAGIGIALFFWLRRPSAPAALARQFSGVHRLLLNKYYVDEIYNAVIVQPIKQAVDRRAVEGRRRRADRRLGQRRRRRRAEPQLVAAPPADRVDPHLRRVALPRRGADSGMVPVELRFDAAGCRDAPSYAGPCSVGDYRHALVNRLSSSRGRDPGAAGRRARRPARARAARAQRRAGGVAR